MLPIWQTLTWNEKNKNKKLALARRTHHTVHVILWKMIYLNIYIYFLLSDCPATSLICVIWHLNRIVPAGQFVCSISARRDGFYLIARSWLRWLWIAYASTLQWIFFLHQTSGFLNSGGRFLLRNAPKQWRLTIKYALYSFTRCVFVIYMLIIRSFIGLNGSDEVVMECDTIQWVSSWCCHCWRYAALDLFATRTFRFFSPSP